MKKILCVTLIVIMMLAMTITVFALPPDNPPSPDPERYLYNVKMYDGINYFDVWSVVKPYFNTTTNTLETSPASSEYRLMKYRLPPYEWWEAEESDDNLDTVDITEIKILNSKTEIYDTNFTLLDQDGHAVNYNVNNATITIIEPSTGSDVSQGIQRFTATYRWIAPKKPDGTFYTKDEVNALFDFKVTGGWAASTLRWVSNTGKFVNNEVIGKIEWEQKISPEINTISIDFIHEPTGDILGSDTVTLNMLTDFVDTDLDGLDDRSGEPEYNEPETPNNWDGTIDTGNWISQTITNMNDWLQSSASWIRSLSLFFSTIFGFLPIEIRGGIVVLVSVIIIFTIMRIIRG